MSKMLDAFKIKSFDLDPVYAEWKDGPVFKGNPKKDPPVDEWLEKIREGCIQRAVPEEYWYKVAQHFMGPKAKARFDEVKQVVVKVHGGKYRWTWKKFKIAMQNMGWYIDANAIETIKVENKSSGLWFMRKKSNKDESTSTAVETKATERTLPTRSNSIWLSKKSLTEEPEEITRPIPSRSKTITDSSFWHRRDTNNEDESVDEVSTQRPTHQKAGSETAVVTRNGSTSKSSGSSKSNATDNKDVTTITHAPVWLLNACNALDFLTNEHPKTMSVLSAILITVGSIPAIPAIGAGAGGAILASGAAHAIGAVAVGLGQALGAAAVKNAQSSHGSTASSH